ncbi:MAG: rhodanese-like domain-containing protein [Bacteroidales bacterium]
MKYVIIGRPAEESSGTAQLRNPDTKWEILSTEKKPIIPSDPSIILEGVFSISNFSDADKLQIYICENNAQNIVFYGVDSQVIQIAECLRKKGKDILFLIPGSKILKDFDLSVSALLRTYLEKQNIQLMLNESLSAIANIHSTLTISTNSGIHTNADLIIYSATALPGKSTAQLSYQPVIQSQVVAGDILYENKSVGNQNFKMSVCHLDKLDLFTGGLSAEELEEKDIRYKESIIHAMDQISDSPEHLQATLKITYGLDGKLYGAQIIGEKIDEQIDFFTSLLAKGGTVSELSDSTPDSTESVSLAGKAALMAENVLNNQVFPIHWDKLERMRMEDDTYLLDVRNRTEFREQHIPNARNIPLHDLQSSIYDIPSDKKILVYCSIGVKAVAAARLLLESGFKHVYNLNGGFITYKSAVRTLYADTLRQFGILV